MKLLNLKSFKPCLFEMKILGIIGPGISVGGILISYLIHRDWWGITENAISDLGRIGLPYNWVMNISLILGSVCLIIYGAWRFKKSKDIGWLLYMLGSVFLGLIGIFPEGTNLHYEVSWGFFVSMFLAILLLSISFLIRGNKLGIVGLMLFLLGVPLALWSLKKFEGVAVAETISIVVFLIWHYLMLGDA